MSKTAYSNVLDQKSTRLFVILAGFFITNAIVAEFVGMKIFSLENTLGISPFEWNIFGHSGSLMLSAGVLIWPVVFVMTDLINEYYGKRGVKMLSYMTAILISFAFVIIFMSIKLTPADFWIGDFKQKGVEDMQVAFSAVYGQGLYIIVGSIMAFLLGQIVDAFIFQKVRTVTSEKSIWIRATVSTIVSQLLDSFLVLYIGFVIGNNWTTSLWLAVGTVNFSYKVFMAILMLPLLYLIHGAIDKYLGKEIASAMKAEAMYS